MSNPLWSSGDKPQVQLEPPAHPFRSLCLQAPSTQRVPHKGKAPKAQFYILGGYFSFLPWCYPRTRLSAQLLFILGQNSSLGWTHHHGSPTIYKTSWPYTTSLSLISETSESTWELLCPQKICRYTSWIWPDLAYASVGKLIIQGRRPIRNLTEVSYFSLRGRNRADSTGSLDFLKDKKGKRQWPMPKSSQLALVIKLYKGSILSPKVS